MGALSEAIITPALIIIGIAMLTALIIATFNAQLRHVEYVAGLVASDVAYQISQAIDAAQKRDVYEVNKTLRIPQRVFLVTSAVLPASAAINVKLVSSVVGEGSARACNMSVVVEATYALVGISATIEPQVRQLPQHNLKVYYCSPNGSCVLLCDPETGYYRNETTVVNGAVMRIVG